ncbi:hypothetical protein BD410DRAFT_793548 [Rickenella mellea]|uniref:F-box domain-containing protein n=1 Tax=Rickenella mellea TaxID=50990 RepID=A0A4Y7PUL7_9AGAM|nr:hypothetical protein BD410DRAFT_793548 [Rickenella mellea]
MSTGSHNRILIGQIPHDVLSSIVLATQPSFDLACAGPTDDVLRDVQTCKDPIRFSQVSRHWRQGILADASLWAKFVLVFGRHNRRIESAMTFLDEWLKRSRGCPLCFAVGFSGKPDAREVAAAAEGLLVHISRWQKATLIGIPPSTGLVIISKMREVMNVNHMTDLCVVLSRLMPADGSNGYPTPGIPNVHKPFVRLHRLRNLTFHWSDPTTFSPFLDCLIVTKLKQLHLKGHLVYSVFLFSDLESLLRRSKPPLELLKMELPVPLPRCDNILPCLRLLPRLVDLELPPCLISQQILEAFARTPYLCPSLSAVEISSCDMQEVVKLAQFVHMRRIRGYRGGEMASLSCGRNQLRLLRDITTGVDS